MKLTKRAAVLLTFTALAASSFVSCKGDDSSDTTSGDGDTSSGDGDTGSGDGDTSSGDGDADPGPVGPQCDKAGKSQCTGSASGIACAKGSTDGVAFVCATGDVCADGECVGQCDAGATECVGDSVVRVCTSDGRSWVTVACQEGTVCEDGACGLGGGLVCVPGEKDCDGAVARTCKADGSGYDEMECPATSTCEDGACEGSVCTVGATKCDDTFMNMSLLQTLQANGDVNAQVIHRCVDGERWVVESCPSTEATMSICTFDGLNAADAARYRAESQQWLTAFYETQGNPPFPQEPAKPVVPADAQASCQEVPEQCGESPMALFFETPADTRECADPEGGDAYWAGYTECGGRPPYAPAVLQTTECSGATICAMNESTLGCQAVPCRPGEAECGEGSSYSVCGSSNSEFYYRSDVGFVGGAMCEGKGSVCASVGESPERSVTCDGERVEPEVPFAQPTIVEVVPAQ